MFHQAAIALRLAGFVGVTPSTLMWIGPVYAAAEALPTITGVPVALVSGLVLAFAMER